METVLARYRNLIILVGVLFLQVLGLAVQVKREDSGRENTRLIRIWAISAVTPFERVVIWVEHGTGNLWHNYCYLRGVRNENRDLKQQIERMRLEQVRLSEDAAQAHRLQALLAFKEQYVAKTVAAQVIGSSGNDQSRIVYIDKGENDGVKRDLAVLTADGIVGKVLLVYASVSQVLLINDLSSGVGVVLEKSRVQCVLRGAPDGGLTLEKVMSDEQVASGETVLTSGGDRIFPKGLPVGTVTKVGNGKEGFLAVKVKPYADLSKVEEVLVLVEKQQQEPAIEETEHTRAADILAQRLPSVPDKPAQPADATAGTQAGSANAASDANVGVKPASAIGGPVAKNPSATGERGSGAAPPPQGAAGTATVGKPPVTQKVAPASGSGTNGSKPPASPERKTTKPVQPPAEQPAAPPNSQTPTDQDSPN